MDAKPTRTPDDANPARRLSSVASAIALLKAFSEDEVGIGISALAKRLGVAKSTAHRLATTLASEGLPEQDAATGKDPPGNEPSRPRPALPPRVTPSDREP